MQTKIICQYAPTADGGHPRYVWELMNALARRPRGLRYELVTSKDLSPKFNTDLYPINAILPPLAERSSFTNRAAWALNRVSHYPRRERQFLQWLKGRPDISGVHFQEWVPWLATPVMRRIKAMGKKVFYTVHNILPHRYPLFMPKPVMDRWIRNACRECDGLFVHTDLLAQKLAAFLGPRRPRIAVIPHGVWTVADSIETVPLKDRLAKKRLLFFGVIRRNKGLDLLLRAAEHLPEYSITIAGGALNDDYVDREIRPLVARLRATGRHVDLQDHFIPDNEIGGLFQSHSAVILPYTQGFVAQSGVVFMALAYGLPVVASEAGGLPDLLGQFKIGLTFHDQTPQSLAQAIRDLHENMNPDDLLAQLHAACQKFSWDAAAAATQAIYGAKNEAATPTHARYCETTPAH